MNLIGIMIFAFSPVTSADTITPITKVYIDSEEPFTISETINVIKERLSLSGYTPQISSDSSANTFHITGDWNPESKMDSILYHTQFENNELQLELALRQDDKIIRSLYADIDVIDGLIIPENNDPTAIFISRDPQLLDEQKAALVEWINNQNEDKYLSLDFQWSSKIKRIKMPGIKAYPAHVLYAFNTDHSFDLTETDIRSADVRREVNGWDITLTFNPRSKNIWQGMTSMAANDDARPVAIVLNDEVIYTHPIRLVNQPCIVSGYMTRSEANIIADKIRLGRLPADVVIH